jgi:hypothetical protein
MFISKQSCSKKLQKKNAGNIEDLSFFHGCSFCFFFLSSLNKTGRFAVPAAHLNKINQKRKI